MKNVARTEHPQYRTRSVLLLTLGLCALLLFPTIFWNFTYDQGTFAYGGSAILHGHRPYIDFWDIKPPNIFYTYALAFTLFGESVRAVRIYDYLNALATIALFFVLAARMWRNTPWRHISAFMAAMAFVLQFYILGDWNTAQTETYSLPWLLGAMLLVIPPRAKVSEVRRSLLRALIAGGFVSISVLYKFPNGLYILLVGATVWTCCSEDRRQHYRLLAGLIAGFTAGLGLQIFYLAISGELVPLWNITTTSTLNYVGNNYSGSFSVFDNIRTSFQTLDLLWIITGIIGWSFWAADRRPRSKNTHNVFVSAMLLLLAAFISFLIVQFQNKGYAYHYVMLLPWADMLIGAGIGHIARVMRQLDTLPRGNNAAILLIGLIILSYVWTSSSPLHARVQQFQSILAGAHPNGYIANDSLADYVTTHTAPTDRIFIFGFEPYVYWKTGRQPATKYLNTIHFKPTNVPPFEREELVHSLTSNPPELFLVETGDRYTSQGNTNNDSRSTIQLRFPEIEKLLSERYVVRDTIQNTIAYYLRR